MARPGSRTYTKRQKLVAVAATEMVGVMSAAAQTGIPPTTIEYWLDRPEFAAIRTKARDAVADEFWAAIQIGVREVVVGLEGEAPLRDKAVALGILWDKHALMTGSATARTETRDITGSLSDDDVRDAIRAAADLLGAGAGRASTPPPDEAAG